MPGASVSLRPADDEDALDYVEELLAANDLPTADVSTKPDCFYVAIAERDRVGIGGVETYGTAGLLRSVVVEEAVRGQGYGTGVCSALEAEARAAGVERLYLLTTSAAEFFAARGYEAVDREAVPASIGETREFAALCPTSATCLRTTIADRRANESTRRST